MKFDVRASGFTLTPDLQQYAEERVLAANALLQSVQHEATGWVELERTTKHHRHGDIYRAEMQFRLPGQDIRVEATAEDIYTAINEAKDHLQREFRRYKGKQSAKTKRDETKAKKMLRDG